ncbi:MAG: hypothetical protein ACRDOS_07990 [Gaiellaceae bacterium]
MKSAAAAAEEQRAWWRPARTVTFGGLGTALHRGELFALRGGAARLLEGLVQVREAFVRRELTTPRSRTSRRTIEIGPRTLALLREHWRESVYRGDRNLVFWHPRGAERPSTRAGARVPTSAPRSPRRGSRGPFRVFHDLRHTSADVRGPPPTTRWA